MSDKEIDYQERLDIVMNEFDGIIYARIKDRVKALFLEEAKNILFEQYGIKEPDNEN
jgi:hypothetical protein